MVFFKLNRHNFEYFTLRAHPARTFISGSNIGITGTINLLKELSSVEFDLRANDAKINKPLHDNQNLIPVPHHPPDINAYGDNRRARIQKQINIIREEPSVIFTSATIKKNTIINELMPYYRQFTNTAHFNFTNYHSLNFFTASNVPSDSALFYPPTMSNGVPISGAYSINNNAFTFEFWINPRYHFINDGTILHLSSNYAVSLITGSNKFHNGEASHFRLKLQLSDSCEIEPSKSTNNGTRKNRLTFLSDDNILERNKWQHVAIAWERHTSNGTGSFYINGAGRGFFVVTSSVKPPTSIDGEALVIGNFFSGQAATDLKDLFNFTSAKNEGLLNINGDATDPLSDNVLKLHSPLNAEIHEIRIFNKKRTSKELEEFRYKSLDRKMLFNTRSGLVFYLPPFFTKETRQHGIYITPYMTRSDMTTTPFNIEFAHRVNGHDMNLENFVRDFAQGEWPKLNKLISGSVVGANERGDVDIFNSGRINKRNLTILPNDNGLFNPNFNLLKIESLYTGSQATKFERFKDDLGNVIMSEISLKGLTEQNLAPAYISSSHPLYDILVGAWTQNISGTQGELFAIPQTTRDLSSNSICWFNISNTFYGSLIKQQSFQIRDKNITGSMGQFQLTLRDDGFGNLYRADAATQHAKWNSIGNIFYPEGVVLIKSPILKHFGRNNVQIEFSGTQNIHILRTYLKLPKGMVNSSSNINYVEQKNESRIMTTSDGVFVSNANIYNKDFNIVAKVILAQSIKKSSNDEFVIKTQIDF